MVQKFHRLYTVLAGILCFIDISIVHDVGYRVVSMIPCTTTVKPTRCTVSQIYFILEQHSTCLDGLSVHHQESKTVQLASGICRTGSVAAC